MGLKNGPSKVDVFRPSGRKRHGVDFGAGKDEVDTHLCKARSTCVETKKNGVSTYGSR